MAHASMLEPITIVSVRLYRTVARRARFASSRASTQGAVSSIYLFALRNTDMISPTASATRNSSTSFATFLYAPVATAFSSSSTGSAAWRSETTPPKYLLDIATVRLTRLP